MNLVKLTAWFFCVAFPMLAVAAPPTPRSPQQQAQLEKRLEWFYQAKYGIMVHYLASQAADVEVERTPEEWDAWVDAVDVDAFAKQCAEAGVGYVIMPLGQQRNYYNSTPNPVYEEAFGFEPGRYAARRDLPMDLYEALKPHGIRMIIYTAAHPYATTGEAAKKGEEIGWVWKNRQSTLTESAAQKWLYSLEWWSNHYGKACSGWWVDGNLQFYPGQAERVVDVLRTGNPDTLIASSHYKLSDMTHGHCIFNWPLQQQNIPPQDPTYKHKVPGLTLEELAKPLAPEIGRWEPNYKIQWHALQFIGKRWGRSDKHKTTESVVNYARNIVERGGVITFDVGIYGEAYPYSILREDGTKNGPYLKIPQGHFEQLCAVRDAVKPIER